MTGFKVSNDKRLVLISGRAHPVLAQAVAEELSIDLLPIIAYDFANSEIYVRFEESVRGADVFILQSHPDPINKWVMEQLIMVDAAKRASAKRITAVAPSYPYARQDKKHKGREPISARLLADLFKTAGADRIMSVDLHASQSQGFFDGPSTTSGRCRPSSSMCADAWTPRTPSSSRPTPDASKSPSSGATAWAACRSPSSIRPGT